MRLAKNVSVLIICLSIIFAVVQPGSSHTSVDIDVTCPLCHTAFKSQTDMSGTRLGMRLDLKPVGPIAAPWSIPKCPNCHFIVYKNEISDKDKELLLRFVNSGSYRDISGDNSTYFLLAKIYEVVGMDTLEIAHTYLKATWQVESDRIKCSKYLEASLAKFESFLSAKKDKSNQYMMAELVSGEIERRLGKFDLALNRFNRLQKSPEFTGIRNIATIIQYQLELIGAKDTAPHEINR